MKYNIYQIPDGKTSQTSFYGKNAKRVLIVLKKSDYVEHSDLLDKIISAVGLNLEEDCLILQLPPEGYQNLSLLKNEYSIETVILFGMELHQLGLQIKVNSNQAIHFQGTNIFRTFLLSELVNNTQNKRILWSALKKIFSHAK